MDDNIENKEDCFDCDCESCVRKQKQHLQDLYSKKE